MACGWRLERGCGARGCEQAEARAVRERCKQGPGGADPNGLGAASAEAAANTLICLTSQAVFLLSRRLAALEKQFLEQGGFTERLCRERKQ
ncbi:MAG TPA: four helix bundle suffix domain-containing protein [Candidatus Brocadiia bacterium]|nr:four helix bundle suffix domain-containing protein [Candidatus Brocadiia bacterium]